MTLSEIRLVNWKSYRLRMKPFALKDADGSIPLPGLGGGPLTSPYSGGGGGGGGGGVTIAVLGGGSIRGGALCARTVPHPPQKRSSAFPCAPQFGHTTVVITRHPSCEHVASSTKSLRGATGVEGS